jgi:hypothetical protein
MKTPLRVLISVVVLLGSLRAIAQQKPSMPKRRKQTKLPHHSNIVPIRKVLSDLAGKRHTTKHLEFQPFRL